MLSHFDVNSLVNILAATVNLFLALFILIKDKKSEVHRSLAVFIFFVSAWIICSFLTWQTSSTILPLFWRKLATACSAMIVTLFFYFALVFPQGVKNPTFINKALIFSPGFFIAFLSISSSLLIKDFTLISGSVSAFSLYGKAAYGSFYPYAAVFFIIYLLSALGLLTYKYFTCSEKVKLQLFYVLFGIGSAGIISIITSLILPLLGNSGYAFLGPTSTLLMAGFIAYAFLAPRPLKVADFLLKSIFYLSVVAGLVGTLLFLQINHLHLIFPFYLTLINLSLSAFVYFQNRESVINKFFGGAIFIAALWVFSIAMFMESASLFQLLLWSKIFYALGAITPVVLLNFSLVFPFEQPALNVNIKRLFVLPIIFFVPIILFTDGLIKNLKITANGIFASPGHLYPAFFVYIVVFMGAAFINLLLKYARSKGADQTRIFYVLGGLLVVGSSAFIFNLVLPWLGYYNLIYLGPFSTTILAIFVSYAIVKHRLMDITVVISRTVAEIIAISFDLAIFLLMAFLYRTNISSHINLPFLMLTVVFGIAIGKTHQRLRLFLQTTSDKVFLHGKYDYYKTLSEATRRMAEKLSLSDTLSFLYSTFRDTVEISNPRIYLPEHFLSVSTEPTCFQVYNKLGKPDPYAVAIDSDSPLIKDLLDKRKPLEDIPVLKASLVIPCLLENRLIGFFVLGPKLSEEFYTSDDKRLLQALANQAAISLDHSRSFDKLRDDLKTTRRNMDRSARLAAIGTLTAGITHEIRNPLTVIHAETERLTKQPRDAVYLENYKNLMLKQLLRVENIIQRMLDFTKDKHSPTDDVNVNTILEEILSSLSIPEKIILQKELGTLRAIKANDEALRQAFINIINNALQSMPEGGKLTIRSYCQNDHVIIDICDTGKGIPEEMQEKIFDAFFSTRHEGTGLGLPIAYRFIREHGGDIKVTSEVGKGSEFKIIF